MLYRRFIQKEISKASYDHDDKVGFYNSCENTCKTDSRQTLSKNSAAAKYMYNTVEIGKQSENFK